MNAETENEVVRRWRQGASQRRIARELKISQESVQRILGRHERHRDAGGLEPSPSCTSRGSILDAYVARIEALVASWPRIRCGFWGPASCCIAICCGLAQ